jgi:hypothetical protein
MSFKLALTAGHYMYTAGKRCLKSIDKNETREWWLNDRIADRIQVLLSEYEGIEILRTDDTTGKTDVSLAARTSAANNFKADFYLSIHHNAGINGGSGGGITAYVYTSASQASITWQKALYNELIKLTGLKGNRSDGCPKANLYEVRETNMPAVLLELGFMDSTTDVPVLLTQDFAYKCAQACVNVIVAKAGLKKKASSTTTPTVGATYKVITTINRYTSVADAQTKTNSKGTYEAGTYYIYNKYPNGSNGMFNISKDHTGASAGSWINPSENVIVELVEPVQKLYRVRKSYDDAKSQKGAFSSLPNAKECCQEAGEGYKVFDWNGKEVYAYTAPEATSKPVTDKNEQTTTTTTKAVYDLEYSQKHLIINNNIAATFNKEACTKAIIAIKKNNAEFDIEIAKAFFNIAPKYRIDPMRAISQSVLETGWFKFTGSSVKATQHNYCGLGATGGGVSGAAFDTIENGVRAQLQHLYAYGCKDELPSSEAAIVDPRFKYVTRGIAPYWEQLAGRWAVPGYDGSSAEASMKAGTTYGQKIDKIYENIMATTITSTDVAKYFADDSVLEPDKHPEADSPTTQPTEETLDIGKVNFILSLLEKLLTAIISLFSKKE